MRRLIPEHRRRVKGVGGVLDHDAVSDVHLLRFRQHHTTVRYSDRGGQLYGRGLVRRLDRYLNASSAAASFVIAQATPLVAVPRSIDHLQRHLLRLGPSNCDWEWAVSRSRPHPRHWSTITGQTRLSPRPWQSPPIDAGSYQVVAKFAGSTDYAAQAGAQVSFKIGRPRRRSLSLPQAQPTMPRPMRATANRHRHRWRGTDYPSRHFHLLRSLGVRPRSPRLPSTQVAIPSSQAMAGASITRRQTAPRRASSLARHPTVKASAAGATYNAAPYSGASASVLGVNNTTITTPVATFTYYASGSTTALSGAPTTAGSYTVVAYFGGNTDYLSQSSTAASFTIAKATPTITVSDAGGTYTSSPYAATATVAGVSGTPAGSLEGVTPTLLYYVGATASGNGASTAPSLPGTYTVVASFTGSTDYSLASASKTFTIIPSGTTTTVSTSSGTIFYGQSDTFTATVKAGSIAAVGRVDFYDTTTGTDLGSATLNGSGVASFTPSVPLPAGTQSITMSYAVGTDSRLAPRA